MIKVAIKRKVFHEKLPNKLFISKNIVEKLGNVNPTDFSLVIEDIKYSIIEMKTTENFGSFLVFDKPIHNKNIEYAYLTRKEVP